MGLTQMLMEEGRQEGLQKGLQEGRQEGLQEGRLEGVREGLIEGIELALSLKFGDDGQKLMGRISGITDIGKLKALKDIIITAADADDLKKRLDN